jgi:hypothetical protein
VKKSVKRHETALRDKQDLLDKVYYACPTNWLQEWTQACRRKEVC